MRNMMVSWWVKNWNIPWSHHRTAFWMTVWYLTARVTYVGFGVFLPSLMFSCHVNETPVISPWGLKEYFPSIRDLVVGPSSCQSSWWKGTGAWIFNESGGGGRCRPLDVSCATIWSLRVSHTGPDRGTEAQRNSLCVSNLSRKFGRSSFCNRKNGFGWPSGS